MFEEKCVMKTITNLYWRNNEYKEPTYHISLNISSYTKLFLNFYNVIYDFLIFFLFSDVRDTLSQEYAVPHITSSTSPSYPPPTPARTHPPPLHNFFPKPPPVPPPPEKYYAATEICPVCILKKLLSFINYRI